MPTNENEVPLSEAARDIDDNVREQISDLTDLDVRRPEKKKRNFNDRTRRLFSHLVGEKRLNRLEHWDIPPTLLLLTILFVLLIVYLAAFVLPGDGDDGEAAAPEPTTEPAATPATGTPSVEPTTDSPAGAAEPGADDSSDEGESRDVATLAPISIHADVADGNISSFYQLWPDSAVLVTPRLAGGTVDMTFDFEAMTVSGSFSLSYERSEDEDENGLCNGSPEAFSGTARGAFDDLPIREAQTSEWYAEGWIPLELAMSGTAVMACATLDGDTDFVESPVDGTATPTSRMSMRLDMVNGQGADNSTVTIVNFSTETDEPSDVKPYWRHRVSLTHTIEQPIPDPLG